MFKIMKGYKIFAFTPSEKSLKKTLISTETHLNSSINSSELFPPDFSVYRKDRTPGPSGISKGGVLVAIKNDLVGTHRTDLDTGCEVVGSQSKSRDPKTSLWACFIDRKFSVLPRRIWTSYVSPWVELN